MSDYLWLKIGVSAAVGGFCLWKLTSAEDETIQQLTNTQKLYMGWFNLFLLFQKNKSKT